MTILKTGGRALIVALSTFLISATSSATPGGFDATFGIGGKSFAPVPDTISARGEAVAVQPDGKIVVAGRCVSFVSSTPTTHFCVIRVLPNGFYDTDFNLTGSKRVFANLGDVEIPRAVAIQPDGKIVVAGHCGPEISPTHTCVVRLLADGSSDDSFGTSGKVKFNFGSPGTQEAFAVTVLPDGKLLLGGVCSGATLSEVGACVVRLHPNGALDTSFGLSGRAIAQTTLFGEQLTSMLVRPDGRIVIATQCNIALPPGNDWRVCVSQLTAIGVWDTTFFGSGTVVISRSAENLKPRLALQADGLLVVAFRCSGMQCAVRLDATGELDASFAYPPAGNPLQIPVPTTGDFGAKPAIQPDGRIIFVTSVPAANAPSGTIDFGNMRVLDTGAFDSSYNAGGAAAKAIGSAADFANDAVLQVDGKLVVVGHCDVSSAFQMCIARFEAGPFTARNCTMDIDGDGRVLATTDALLFARVAFGMNGGAVINGVNFASNATRTTWPLIRDYLALQCGLTGLAP